MPEEPASDPRSDEELMAAYVAGDAAAFQLLFERYAPALLRTARRHLRTEEDARDLVQQTFLQLHRGRRDFRGDAPFRPWLFTIALNLRREHYRRRARRPEAPLDSEAGAKLHSPTGGAAAVEASALVRQALGRLPPDQREAIVLHWFEGYSFGEIAALVGASAGAVRVRAHRGYGALRKALGTTGGNESPPPRVHRSEDSDGLR
jgi:RNA polymerase sigma-70 factor (ECF subfamily)